MEEAEAVGVAEVDHEEEEGVEDSLGKTKWDFVLQRWPRDVIWSQLS